MQSLSGLSILQGDHHIISSGLIENNSVTPKGGMLLSVSSSGYKPLPVSHSSLKLAAVLLEDVAVNAQQKTEGDMVVPIALHGKVRLEKLMFADSTPVNAATIEELRKIGIYAIGVIPKTAQEPVIETDLQDAVATIGEQITLVVIASSPDSGNLSYKWLENSTKTTSGGTVINGATSAAYQPNTSTAGTKNYYVEITNKLNNTSAKTSSVAVSVTTSGA